MDKKCDQGCRCRSPTESPSPTNYDCTEWDDQTWQTLRFSGRYSRRKEIASVVYFHHKAEWHRTEDGCRLDFTIHGDLDNDGIYSTYTVITETTRDGFSGHWPDESLLWE